MAKKIFHLTVGAAAIAMLIFLLCGEESRIAEGIVTGIGAGYRQSLAGLFAGVPFSVAALLLLCLPAVPIAVGCAFAFYGVSKVLRGVMFLFSVLALSFLLSFGFGYRRKKIASSLPVGEVDGSACAFLLSLMTDCLSEPIDLGEKEELLSAAEALFTSGSAVKEIRFSAPYRAVGILGFYSPFTGEVSVDGSLPLPTEVFTAAHELAHAEGYAREEEADYVAFCRLWESGNPALRYAAAFAMYPAVADTVARENPALCREIMARLERSASDSLYRTEKELRASEKEEIQSAAEAVADAALSPLGGSTADYCQAVILLAARYGTKGKGAADLAAPDGNEINCE